MHHAAESNHPSRVTFRRLREAGVTATTASRDQAVHQALKDAGFALGLPAAPERYSLVTRDAEQQNRAADRAIAALGQLGVEIAVRNTAPGRADAARSGTGPTRVVAAPAASPSARQEPARPTARR
ncbi:hypothetical protein [Kitasatospora sp. NRRL B-11411]|uniref:hypothetical protein n=1 Tax=Kitasatospora sp. NRRL B-11411 TaxID=1463822 RepID=UPI0004C44B01|nr:hypothetical protein [Kitasatospora sp. NRRL B-11411]